MVELWQTEWCPASRRVRQRLTEVGVDYLIHQVPVEKPDRVALRRATGSDTIPALVLPDGRIAVGEDDVMRLVAQTVAEPAEAAAHRQKAAKARRRYLEEECECSQPTTP
ncbi:MAG: glutathione S-transferase N-terminal domain-containing protein [Acidobacteriota bacterium]|nr:glutathione S-transferase N-terminal domain-containing protein [Acidobacteriota bacterium]MDE3191436.1 glutathione S-transferase N-terminal domain-containing protein [Acidobacteriota bacterium]